MVKFCYYSCLFCLAWQGKVVQRYVFLLYYNVRGRNFIVFAAWEVKKKLIILCFPILFVPLHPN